MCHPQVRAPDVGPYTTLLVTDIENSTRLWESLPAEVMDAALEVHHRLLRGLLRNHLGYESYTEVCGGGGATAATAPQVHMAAIILPERQMVKWIMHLCP